MDWANRRIRGLFEGRGQHDRPHHEPDREKDHAEKLDIDQVRPDPNLVLLLLLHGLFACRDPLVVLYTLMHREPGKKRDEEEHEADGHVVRLRNDEKEIRIEHAQEVGGSQEAEKDVGDLLRPHLCVLER